jgi:hypothetical protein
MMESALRAASPYRMGWIAGSSGSGINFEVRAIESSVMFQR